MAGGEVRTIVLTVAIITLLAVGLYMVDPTMCGMVSMKDGFTVASMPVMSADATASVPQTGMPGMPGMAGTPGTPGMPGMPGAGAMAGSVPSAGAMPGPQQVNAAASNAYVASQQARGSPASTAGFQNKEKEGFANLEDITGPADFGATPNPNGCYPRDQLTPGELLPKDANSTWAQQNPMGTGSLKGKNFLSAGALVGVNTVGQSLRNANQQLRSEPPNPQVPVSVFFNSTIEPDTNRRDMEIA